MLCKALRPDNSLHKGDPSGAAEGVSLQGDKLQRPKRLKDGLQVGLCDGGVEVGHRQPARAGSRDCLLESEAATCTQLRLLQATTNPGSVHHWESDCTQPWA